MKGNEKYYRFPERRCEEKMLAEKRVFWNNAAKELKISKEAFVNFVKVYSDDFSKKAICAFSMHRKEAIAAAAVLTASVLATSVIVGANYQQRRIITEANDVVASQILGNENTIATNTLTKRPDRPILTPIVSDGNSTAPMRTTDVITPPQAAYSMENVELLAQMMFAEEGVFFSWSANDPATIERVHKLAGSVILHRLNSHYSGAQTIADVLYSPGQYDIHTIMRVESRQTMPPQVYQWAEELLTEGALGPDTLVFQAQFVQGSSVYDHIGNQYFCCR